MKTSCDEGTVSFSCCIAQRTYMFYFLKVIQMLLEKKEQKNLNGEIVERRDQPRHETNIMIKARL